MAVKSEAVGVETGEPNGASKVGGVDESNCADGLVGLHVETVAGAIWQPTRSPTRREIRKVLPAVDNERRNSTESLHILTSRKSINPRQKTRYCCLVTLTFSLEPTFYFGNILDEL